MISLKKYLDLPSGSEAIKAAEEPDLLKVAIEEYGATLEAVGNCCAKACPVTVHALNQELVKIRCGLSVSMESAKLAEAATRAREQLDEWGRATMRHYHEKADEVKELLLTMARAAQSVSARDARCAGQMNEMTDRLSAIASLEDLTEIRVSIKRSARELKTSIERMTAEGKATLDALREQVSTYQTKLDVAEAIASRDALTGLSSRMYVESQIEQRIAAGAAFCVALIDIDGFKRTNDRHGHLMGDELLKQFGAELKLACRAMDVIGRWGGDEFLLIFDCGLTEGQARAERLRKWICGSYTLEGKQGEIKLQVQASIGLAVHGNEETMNELLERADAAMYAEKELARHKKSEKTLVAL
jgi:diguanylate cyclase (GGDEF)-like protein